MVGRTLAASALAALGALPSLALAGGAPLAKPDPFTVKVMDGCPDWNAVYWPIVSFWATEIWRSQLAIDPSDTESLQKLRALNHQAAAMTCHALVDPRIGMPAAEQSRNFMLEVLKRDAMTLEFPKMQPFYENLPGNMSDWLFGDKTCTSWSEYMMCDLGWWAKTLKGSKDYEGGICWDKVNWLGYFFTGNGKDEWKRPRACPPDVDEKEHPEYMACLESPVSYEVIDAICPLGGHYKDGSHNVPHWGDGVPAGTATEEVDACRAKLDVESQHFGRIHVGKHTPQTLGMWE